MRADVAVIGAGCAGLSAAVALAEAGLRVVVLEQAPRAGGRATTFIDRHTGERVDNGQHVLFGCYRETYAFLERLGVSHLAPLQARLSLTMADSRGRAYRLRCPNLPPPWHLVAGLLGWRALSLGDRLRATAIRPVLAEVRRAGASAVAARVDPALTVSQWLTRHKQSPRLCDWLWHPLALAALNQSPDVAAARPFVRILGELFGPRVQDSAVGLPAAPLDELFAIPAAKYLEQRGGRVLLNTPARIVVGSDGAIDRVQTPAGDVTAEVLVSAVPWHAFAMLWTPTVPASLAAVVRDASCMLSSPIVTANLWFDRPGLPNALVGLVDGPMHWAFDKAALLGRGTSHLSVVASGAAELAGRSNADVAAVASAHLRGALPLLRDATLRRSLIVREHRATFSLAPGQPPRPAAATALDGLYLAGDWTDTGLPATIEGAVQSGHEAARLILQRRARGTRAQASGT